MTIRHVHEAEPTDVYWLYSHDGELLYIGCTFQLEIRLRHHSKNQPWWEQVARVEVDHFPDRRSALSAERDAIYRHRPTHNRPGRWRPLPPLPPIVDRRPPLDLSPSERIAEHTGNADHLGVSS